MIGSCELSKIQPSACGLAARLVRNLNTATADLPRRKGRPPRWLRSIERQTVYASGRHADEQRRAVRADGKRRSVEILETEIDVGPGLTAVLAAQPASATLRDAVARVGLVAA
jgi:hypothetical protein